MIEIHKAKSRGVAKITWLDSRHSFSFGDWYEPTRMGFGTLRVLNDDVIAPNKGFGMHNHANMEIVTIVLSGVISHKDSLGNEGSISPGEVQRMSAGKGIMHSELNASDEPVHLLQIWVEPKQQGISPSYEQKGFHLTKNKLIRIVDGNRLVGALYIHQNATFWLGEFDDKQEISLNTDKNAYVFIISGNATVNGHELTERDAIAATNEKILRITFSNAAKILIMEIPGK